MQVEGFSGADARGAVEVADGVADDAAAGTGGADARGEVDVVEHVEHFNAELSLDTLRDRNALQDGQIEVREAWTVDLVAPQRAAKNIGSASRAISTASTRVIDCG